MKKLFIALIVLLAVLLIIGVLPSGSSPSTQVVDMPINTVQYTCDGGKMILARYYEGTTTPVSAPGEPPIPSGSVSLTLDDGSNMTLPRTLSADGLRYANSDESFIFWSKGNGALVLENGVPKNYTNCVASQ
jgi:membrane-bound inhibitor of C-type lysozyme